MTTSLIHQVGKMTSNGSNGMEPTPSRPGLPPHQGQARSKEGPERDSGDVLQLDTPLDADTGVEKLYQQKWLELSTRRRNIKEPAVSRPS